MRLAWSRHCNNRCYVGLLPRTTLSAAAEPCREVALAVLYVVSHSQVATWRAVTVQVVWQDQVERRVQRFSEG